MGEIIPLLWLPGIVMLVLVGISALFSGSETALFYLSAEEVRAMRIGNAREQAVAAIPSRHPLGDPREQPPQQSGSG